MSTKSKIKRYIVSLLILLIAGGIYYTDLTFRSDLEDQCKENQGLTGVAIRIRPDQNYFGNFVTIKLSDGRNHILYDYKDSWQVGDVFRPNVFLNRLTGVCNDPDKVLPDKSPFKDFYVLLMSIVPPFGVLFAIVFFWILRPLYRYMTTDDKGNKCDRAKIIAGVEVVDQKENTKLYSMDREKLIDRLVELYAKDMVAVANICDNVLDRSGELLGDVRSAFRKDKG